MTPGKWVVRLQWLMTVWRRQENHLRSCNTEDISTCISKTAWCNTNFLFLWLCYVLAVSSPGCPFPTLAVAHVKLNLPPLPLHSWHDFEDNLPLGECFPSWPYRLDAEWMTFLTFDCSVMSKIQRCFGFCLSVWTWVSSGKWESGKTQWLRIYSDEPNRSEHVCSSK